MPGAQELALNVASRYSDYDAFGDTTNSKASFRWRPIEDLLVRGTWAEGFRAPSVSDMYGGVGQTFDFYSDPCDTIDGLAANNPEVAARCAGDIANYAGYQQLGQGGSPAYGGQSGTPFLSGSNEELTPETAISRSLGMVYSPGYVDGLSVSVDWWRTRINNVITGFTATGILNDCYVFGIDSQCGYFTRDAETGVVDSLIRTGRNAGFWDVEGWDLEVNYQLPQTAWGDFGINWQSTYYSNFETKSDDTENTTAQPNVSWGSTFRIRSVANLNWEKDDFGASWTARYHSGMREQCYFTEMCNNLDFVNRNGSSFPIHETGSNTFHDVQVRMNVPWDATIAVGVNNVFGREGQVMFTAPSSGFSYYGGFDIGRFTYMKYQQRF